MESKDNQQRVLDVVPKPYDKTFSFEYFNDMQSALTNQILNSDENMVVAAPTGSGKTVVHELAIIRSITSASNPNLIKCVFIAPNKALCQQRSMEWGRMFLPYNILVVEITGDTDYSKCMQHLAKANIIITTPEKWDSVTRLWRSHIFLLGSVDLLLLDEVHHISETRGATLETTVVRMRTLNEAFQQKLTGGNLATNNKKMRIVALSATLPNVVDIGEWLECKPEAIHFFDDSFRALPLTIKTVAYGSSFNNFLFEKSLDNHVPSLVNQYSDGKQTLVFCSSKKGAEKLAASLVGKVHYDRFKSNKNSCLSGGKIGTPNLCDANLSILLQNGIAYHHGGLPADDRAFIESKYLSGSIQVLCATSTLAYGVNLPAHLVIVKGTNQWRGGSSGYERLAKSTVLQMVGRAGRVQFDSYGFAIIMTSKEDKHLYDIEAMEMDTVESTIQNILIEAICAEITQTVITDVSEAIKWMKSTFYYIRVKRSPNSYGFGTKLSATELETHLRESCTRALNQLGKVGIISFDDECSYCITPNAEATIMTRNIIRYTTMVSLISMPSDCTMQQLLFTLCKDSVELHKPVKKHDKKLLNEYMNTAHKLRYNNKYKGDASGDNKQYKIKLVQEGWHKAYALIQSAIERIQLPEFTLRVEQSEIVEQLMRILSAFKELCIKKHQGKNLLLCILLQRAVNVRAWDCSQGNASIIDHIPNLSGNTRHYLKAAKEAKCVSDVSVILSGIELQASREADKLESMKAFAKCGLQEATQLINYFHKFREYQVKVDTRVSSPTSSYSIGTATFAVSRVHCTNPTYDAHRNSCNISTELPEYALIAYSVPTRSLLCYRKLCPTAYNENFSVPIPASSTSIYTYYNNNNSALMLRDIHTCIICTNKIGFDCNVSLSDLDNKDEIEYYAIPSATSDGPKNQKLPKHAKPKTFETASHPVSVATVSPPALKSTCKSIDVAPHSKATSRSVRKGKCSSTNNLLEYFNLRNGENTDMATPSKPVIIDDKAHSLASWKTSTPSIVPLPSSNASPYSARSNETKPNGAFDEFRCSMVPPMCREFLQMDDDSDVENNPSLIHEDTNTSAIKIEHSQETNCKSLTNAACEEYAKSKPDRFQSRVTKTYLNHGVSKPARELDNMRSKATELNLEMLPFKRFRPRTVQRSREEPSNCLPTLYEDSSVQPCLANILQTVTSPKRGLGVNATSSVEEAHLKHNQWRQSFNSTSSPLSNSRSSFFMDKQASCQVSPQSYGKVETTAAYQYQPHPERATVSQSFKLVGEYETPVPEQAQACANTLASTDASNYSPRHPQALSPVLAKNTHNIQCYPSRVTPQPKNEAIYRFNSKYNNQKLTQGEFDDLFF